MLVHTLFIHNSGKNRIKSLIRSVVGKSEMRDSWLHAFMHVGRCLESWLQSINHIVLHCEEAHRHSLKLQDPHNAEKNKNRSATDPGQAQHRSTLTTIDRTSAATALRVAVAGVETHRRDLVS
jgi:hypothetical protein